MSMSLTERAKLDALAAEVERLKRSGYGSLPESSGLAEWAVIKDQLADIADRLHKIETRSKPGPKPKGNA